MTTIRGRLLAVLAPGLVLVLLAGGMAVYWIAKAGLLRQLDAELTARAHALASLVTHDQGQLDFEFDEWHDQTMGDGFFEFRTPGGDVLRRSPNMADSSLPIRADLRSQPVFEDVQLPDGRGGRAASLAFQPRLDDPGELAGSVPVTDQAAVIVITAIDRGPIDRALGTLLGALIIAGCVVGATAGVLVTVGVRFGLAPLDRLSRQLQTVGGPTISGRFDDAGIPSELAPVHRELNRMLDRVEQTLGRERTFADAAAHELRTPLAELRATAEVAIRWPDPSRAADSLNEVLSIGREMERLVESLLLISRANVNELDGTIADVQVASIVRTCLEHVRAKLQQKRLRITVDLDEAQTLPAPPQALQIIVRNLIDNAVQYTPAGGGMTISTQRGGNGSPSLLVENGPVELAQDDLPRLFEPFWRTDRARSEREHVGLGLTVVHRIAHSVGLRVDAELIGDRLQIRVSIAD